MKNKVIQLIISGLVGSMLIWGCHESDPKAVEQGQFRLHFDNVAGNQNLQLGNQTYTNASGEPFTVKTLAYYISNIRLKKADGSEYVVPQDSSYFLVRESDPASQVLALRQVPAGDYTGVSYLIGVDSLRNTMDISRRTGVLDPAGGHSGGGMYWDWNSGYIFFKLEGTSPLAPADATGNNFRYHIGLFGGYKTPTLNNLRTVSLSFNSTVARVAEGEAPEVTIQADVLKVFDGKTSLSIARNSDIMVSALSASVADNYARMFRYGGLKED